MSSKPKYLGKALMAFVGLIGGTTAALTACGVRGTMAAVVLIVVVAGAAIIVVAATLNTYIRSG